MVDGSTKHEWLILFMSGRTQHLSDNKWYFCTEVEFELNQGEIVFGIFLPKMAVLAETNYGPFLFSQGPIYEQNESEINFSTCATD